jgi:hypothetical protein
MGVLGIPVLTVALFANEMPASPDLSPPDVETERRTSYVKTALETVALLGAGTIWYWRAPDISDSDLKFSWSSQQGKLFSTKDIVFDDNLFDTNMTSHPRAGWSYFQIARGNGFGFAASFFSAFLASTAWEYLSEFTERPSMNDLIVTPISGAMIGEASYQLGRYFASGPPGPLNQIGALIFSPVATLNDWAAGRRRSFYGRRSWNRFDLDAGGAFSSFSTGGNLDELNIAAAERLVTNRAYRKGGQGVVTAHPGQWTALDGNVLVDGDRTRGIGFHARVLMWGRYQRDYDETDGDGWGLLAGLGGQFDYDSRTVPHLFDRTASVGLVGPRIEFERQRGELLIRGTLNSVYGLSAVQSLAFPSAQAELSGMIIKSVLREQGYYYAQGLLNTAMLAAEYGRIQLALMGRLDAFWSINVRDRFQNLITHDFSLTDQRTTIGAAMTARPWPGPLRVVTSLERVIRRGTLLDTTTVAEETRAGVAAAVVF